MRGDPTGTMPKQILTILEPNSGSAQTSAKGVFEVMYAHRRKSGTLPSPLPRRAQHVAHGQALVAEHMRRV